METIFNVIIYVSAFIGIFFIALVGVTAYCIYSIEDNDDDDYEG